MITVSLDSKINIFLLQYESFSIIPGFDNVNIYIKIIYKYIFKRKSIEKKEFVVFVCWRKGFM